MLFKVTLLLVSCSLMISLNNAACPTIISRAVFIYLSILFSCSLKLFNDWIKKKRNGVLEHQAQALRKWPHPSHTPSFITALALTAQQKPAAYRKWKDSKTITWTATAGRTSATISLWAKMATCMRAEAGRRRARTLQALTPTRSASASSARTHRNCPTCWPLMPSRILSSVPSPRATWKVPIS